jgi:hypothetical protein
MPRIPKVLHYCFGFDKAFGGKPWSLVHYICVRSAIERIKPDKAFIYYEFEPTGEWWIEAVKFLTPIKIRAPREIFGNELCHPAHRADVVRLEMLMQQGGIYLDADVFVHKSFDHLLDNSVVLGQEGIDAEHGVANAVILAEPGARFLKTWYQDYRSFRSKGVDQYWNEHSVRRPGLLAKSHPGDVTILPHTAFYWPLWTPDDLKLLFEAPPSVELCGSLANHLWESNAWGEYLEGLTPGLIRTRDSAFHRWARPFVKDFANDYGALSPWEKWKRYAFQRKHELRVQIANLLSKLKRAAL